MPTPLPTFVWTDVTGSWVDPHPGILLAWRRCERDHRPTWEGWVVSAWAGGTPAHGEQVYVHQSWMDAAHIRIAAAPKPGPDRPRHRPAHDRRPGLAG